MLLVMDKTRVRTEDPFSQVKEIFEFEKRDSDAGHQVVSFNSRGACVFIEHLLLLNYGVEKINVFHKDDILSEVVVLGENNEYMGSILYPVLTDEICRNISNFYPLSLLQEEAGKTSDAEFTQKYRCKKEDITNEAGMLTFIGDDDYGIMKGDGFADLDEVLSTIKFKVMVVSR